MVNRNRKMIFTALSTALVLSMLLTGSRVYVQGKTTVSDSTQLAKTAGDKKVEVIKG
ncbi:hypothetical protein [Paenibacillus albiflavus]|uniref:hypothetical protein n=1 Tax=Paenibacillus albiflavus TaxID=2545760 RepID=UPI001404D180|nr:hypothetical protein [Paenibacillus albiflavus]